MKKILEFIVMVLFIPFFFLPLIVMTLLSRYVFSVQAADVLAQVAPGQPCITYDDREYLTDIQDIHVTDEHIYLYYEAIHTVEVFRADGTCLCAIAFPEEKGHRGSELKGRGEEVHLLVNNDLYVFRGDELLAYYDNADYPGYSTERYLSWANSVSSRRRNAEGSYSLLGGVNVYRTDAAANAAFSSSGPSGWPCVLPGAVRVSGCC